MPAAPWRTLEYLYLPNNSLTGAHAALGWRKRKGVVCKPCAAQEHALVINATLAPSELVVDVYGCA